MKHELNGYMFYIQKNEDQFKTMDHTRVFNNKPIIKRGHWCFFFSQQKIMIARPNEIPMKASHGKVSVNFERKIARQAVNNNDIRYSVNNDNSPLTCSLISSSLKTILSSYSTSCGFFYAK